MLSIWLIPTAETSAKLSALIHDLSKTYSTDNFLPHITLLSGIMDIENQAVAKLTRWAKQLKPIQAELTSVEYLELYYKCLFFNAAESAELLLLREQAEQLFNHTNVQPFIPHVSFLYGNLPLFKQQEIISGLGADFLQTIRLDKIQLVRTIHAVENWELLVEIAL